MPSFIALMPRQNRSGNRRPALGFTLLELLIVISILAVLSSMLMPLLSIANHQSRASGTRAVMAKVDTALRLFRAEIGPYPYQSILHPHVGGPYPHDVGPSPFTRERRYSDIGGGEEWTNRLAYHLGTDIASADRQRLIDDGDKAARLYQYNQSNNKRLNDYAFEANDSRDGGFAMANRMAAERARLAIYSGNPWITSPKLRDPYFSWHDLWKGNRLVRRVMPTTPLLESGITSSSPASKDNPGMAKDYLQGEIEARYISGTAILDAWGKPLIYVCQVTEGMVSAPSMSSGGVHANALDWGLQPLGRTTLVGLDPHTGQPSLDAITHLPVTAHPDFLPDLNHLRHSDRRYYAPRGMELEFELWSAGRDGKADWMRTAAVNVDNVSLLPYDKSIP